MPLIQGIDILPDGFQVVFSNGAILRTTSTDIPANMKSKPIAQIEAWINNFLALRLSPRGMFAAVHIKSIAPLNCDVVVANDPIPNEPWWS